MVPDQKRTSSRASSPCARSPFRHRRGAQIDTCSRLISAGIYQNGTCYGAELLQTLVFVSTSRPLGSTRFCHCDLPRTKMVFSTQELTQSIFGSGLWNHLFVDWTSFAFSAMRAVSFRVSRSLSATSPLCGKRSCDTGMHLGRLQWT